jgi:hypothetical protein
VRGSGAVLGEGPGASKRGSPRNGEPYRGPHLGDLLPPKGYAA